VTNRVTSQDSLSDFLVDAPTTVKTILQPQPDSDYDVLATYRGRPVANWGFLALLAPSRTSTALYFEAVGVPDTALFWAAGSFPPPDEEAGDTMPTDLIKYHSVPGKTVGVTAWPADRTAGALLTRLRNLTTTACGPTLAWITDGSLCSQLTSDLDQAQAYRSNGQLTEARSTLDHFIGLLRGLGGPFAPGVTSPGFWLLTANATIVKAII
jgi:hypothetical protein